MAFTDGSVPRYGLRPPEQDDALVHLARAFGAARAAALWGEACREARVRCDADHPMPPADFRRAAEALARREGPAGVIGQALAVRARSYLLLVQLAPAGGVA